MKKPKEKEKHEGKKNLNKNQEVQIKQEIENEEDREFNLIDDARSLVMSNIIFEEHYKRDKEDDDV